MYRFWGSSGQRSRSHVHLNNAGKTFAIATAIGSSVQNTAVLDGIAYRPERGHFHNVTKNCDLINSVNTGNVLLIGDFNFPQD